MITQRYEIIKRNIYIPKKIGDFYGKQIKARYFDWGKFEKTQSQNGLVARKSHG